MATSTTTRGRVTKHTSLTHQVTGEVVRISHPAWMRIRITTRDQPSRLRILLVERATGDVCYFFPHFVSYAVLLLLGD
jgi:hypothetical protein